MVYYKICKAFCSLNSVLVVGAICFVRNVTIQGGYWLSKEILGKLATRRLVKHGYQLP